MKSITDSLTATVHNRDIFEKPTVYNRDENDNRVFGSCTVIRMYVCMYQGMYVWYYMYVEPLNHPATNIEYRP